ncbi:MAG: hypothetical protein UV94_C0006G0053 [Parcubacteria group bacterium GW2011_GWC1_43_30]|nr:MAG: hypothetical protein UV94_C0006G0053 [Parcubacteria group bacterium GW2011_GWC1_43_30]
MSFDKSSKEKRGGTRNSVAIILAAGRGIRLRPLSDASPKCLIPVGEFSILYRQIKSLQTHGIKKIILVVGFMAEKIKRYTEEAFPDLKIQFVYNHQFEVTNTIYSLALAAKTVMPGTEVFLLNGDVVFDPNIISLLQNAECDESYVAAQMGLCTEEEIKIELASDKSVARLSKKIPPTRAIGEAIGINKFSPKFFIELKKSLKSLKDAYPMEYFEYAVEHVLNSGAKIYPLDIKELKAIEIDFLDDLNRAQNEVLPFLS